MAPAITVYDLLIIFLYTHTHYIYIYIYIYTHTHRVTESWRPEIKPVNKNQYLCIIFCLFRGLVEYFLLALMFYGILKDAFHDIEFNLLCLLGELVKYQHESCGRYSVFN